MEVNEIYKRILIVDDDIDLLEQHKILLEQKGFEIVTAETGEEGYTAFESEKPDAVIVDLIMEETDSGFVLCHKIKRTERGKKIPVFILTSATYETGYKFSAVTEEEKKWIKCDGLMHKPVSVQELISKLEKFH